MASVSVYTQLITIVKLSLDNTFKKYNDEFREYIDKNVESSEIIIDRSKDSIHPRFKDIIYPVDYGYLKNTKSMDKMKLISGSDQEQIKKLIEIPFKFQKSERY